ncbi:GtrA family protein [Streptococcus infantarius]|uniref:GtrA family protein n=1 Tax=Streptococcus infantarius TaxID=102684 RepID=UPI0022E45204|nr:GtrA family protein [Streptococcus infantarius]
MRHSYLVFFSSLFNFMMNKSFVFQKGDKTSILKYFMLVIGQISVSALLVTLGNHLFPGVQLSLVKVVVDTVLFMISYKIQKKYIFTKKGGI